MKGYRIIAPRRNNIAHLHRPWRAKFHLACVVNPKLCRGFPFDGGCTHRLNRAVANASFWAAPRTKPHIFPDQQTFSGLAGISREVIFRYRGV
jgi:hypothetical protein